jgi:hypothetical protein
VSRHAPLRKHAAQLLPGSWGRVVLTYHWSRASVLLFLSGTELYFNHARSGLRFRQANKWRNRDAASYLLIGARNWCALLDTILLEDRVPPFDYLFYGGTDVT